MSNALVPSTKSAAQKHITGDSSCGDQSVGRRFGSSHSDSACASLDIAMAFMLIQHLDPKCHSILPELLSNATRIPLLEAIDAMRIEVNRIYVMPSNVDISITDGPLRAETASHRPKAAFAHRHLHALFGGSAQDPGHRRYSLGHRLGWYCGEQMEMDGLAQSLYYSWLASGQTVSPTRPTRLAQDGSYGERYED